jgi:hypothetical protein
MVPSAAAKSVPGVQHLKTVVAAVAAPAGTSLPGAGFEERFASFGQTAGGAPAGAQLAMVEFADRPGFLTLFNMGRTVPFLLERGGGSGGGSGGSSGGSSGPTIGYLCNDLGSYVHLPGSAAAKEARHG